MASGPGREASSRDSGVGGETFPVLFHRPTVPVSILISGESPCVPLSFHDRGSQIVSLLQSVDLSVTDDDFPVREDSSMGELLRIIKRFHF